MFDISLGEMAVIGAVALVVIGPERLPKVARTLGLLVGRAQRFAASVKADLDRELTQSELAKIEAEIRSESAALHNTIHQPLAQAQAALTSTEPLAVQPALAPPVQVAAPDAHVLTVQPVQPIVGLPPQRLPEPSATSHADSGMLPSIPDDGQLDLFRSLPAAPPPARDRR